MQVVGIGRRNGPIERHLATEHIPQTRTRRDSQSAGKAGVVITGVHEQHLLTTASHQFCQPNREGRYARVSRTGRQSDRPRRVRPVARQSEAIYQSLKIGKLRGRQDEPFATAGCVAGGLSTDFVRMSFTRGTNNQPGRRQKRNFSQHAQLELLLEVLLGFQRPIEVLGGQCQRHAGQQSRQETNAPEQLFLRPVRLGLCVAP